MTTDPKPHERPHSEEVEVESDEKQDGEPIEVNEKRLPSRAMATHEEIRQEGKRAGARCPCTSVVSGSRRPVDGGLDGGERDFPCSRANFPVVI